MREVLAPYVERLAEAGVAVPWLEARLLVGLALGKERAVYSHEDAVSETLVSKTLLDGAVEARLEALLARRLKGEPISRMRGWREFWSMRFAINDACLDPRPDSETLVAAAIEHCHAASKARLNILDYGTGCGCLLLAVLAHCENARGLGLDCQKGALAMAQENAAVHGLDARAGWLVSHWCDALDENAQADIILANPPYIATPELDGLAREVREFEPRLALDGGVDGLAAWRQLMPRFVRRLRSDGGGDGAAFVEIGAGQEAAVLGLAASHGLGAKARYCDLNGVIRVVELIKKNG